ncbi:helix-turn-helix transcriptional regulator [Aurantiacibacter suaedae]|uniref:helix-turn-helix transcriptional regulator n=1 Tax=Aurantiacibacter suaedae TaxID=2545755 RepID=UPI0010F6BEE7|nr:helix-turn-helix transcriptional regulator [Aurantiacibacter suaedae]
MIGSDVLLELYSCPTEPTRWQGLLDWMCGKVEATSAVVQRFRHSDGFMEQTWIARDTASTRASRLHDELVNNAANPRFNLNLLAPSAPNGVIRDADIFSQGCPQLGKFRERLHAAGLGESISVDTHHVGNQSVAVTVHRRSGDTRPFTREDEELLLSIRPHIGKAADLSWELARRNDELRQAQQIADLLQIGIIVCTEARQLRWANEAAEEMLDRSPHISADGGTLRGSRLDRDKQLHLMLNSRETQGCETLVLGAGEEDELHLGLIRFADPQGGFALLVSEPRRSFSPSVDEIARLLQLTQAEARVTAALFAGSTLKEYAQSRGISEGSARNQLKQVLSKTDARRQSELVLRLSNSVLFHARTGPQSPLLS